MTALAEKLGNALKAPPRLSPLEGDYAELRALASAEAAVLIAVTDREEPGLLLTVRREHLRTHAGQIAFPGGRIDPGEQPIAAALREARRLHFVLPPSPAPAKAQPLPALPPRPQLLPRTRIAF